MTAAQSDIDDPFLVFPASPTHDPQVVGDLALAPELPGSLQLPLVGDPIVSDGQQWVPVTFLDMEPDASIEVLLVESCTFPLLLDDPSEYVFRKVGPNGLRVLTLLMPAGLMTWYRIARVTHFSANILTEPQGRQAVFQGAIRDPHNPTTIGADPVNSLLQLPGAMRHPAWDITPSESAETSTRHLTVPQDDRPDRDCWAFDLGDDDHTTVILDGDVWMRYGLNPKTLESAGLAGRFLLISSMEFEDRRRDMHNPEALRVVVESALDAAGWRDGRQVTVAGQSWGGCGAIWLAAKCPDLVDYAIAQSPSLFFDHTLTAQSPEHDGTLIQQLKQGLIGPHSAPIRLSVGAYERHLTPQVARFADDCRAAGMNVSFRSTRGGHHYASWRHDLLFALMRPRP